MKLVWSHSSSFSFSSVIKLAVLASLGFCSTWGAEVVKRGEWAGPYNPGFSSCKRKYMRKWSSSILYTSIKFL